MLLGQVHDFAFAVTYPQTVYNIIAKIDKFMHIRIKWQNDQV
jgi:hypothetical protein